MQRLRYQSQENAHEVALQRGIGHTAIVLAFTWTGMVKSKTKRRDDHEEEGRQKVKQKVMSYPPGDASTSYPAPDVAMNAPLEAESCGATVGGAARSTDSGDANVGSFTTRFSERVRAELHSSPVPNLPLKDPHEEWKAHGPVEPNLQPVSGREEDYMKRREALLRAEQTHSSSWQKQARSNASLLEVQAQQVVFKIRECERINLFGNLPGEAVPDDEKTRDMGGRFLRNINLIEDSKVLDIARHAPKGCHLHLHFNSQLDPTKLLLEAKELVPDTMFVRCTPRPLLTEKHFQDTEIIFNVLPADTPTGNIFAADYNPNVKAPGSSPWMKWQTFCDEFLNQVAVLDGPLPEPESTVKSLRPAENWAREKMVITSANEHGTSLAPQTHNGAWACFNQGTRAFKGLLNYESIYTKYIGLAIDNMVEDCIMYCEMRPMLLDKCIPTDDGKGQLDHAAQMRIVCREMKVKQEQYGDRFPFGVKVIYCTPRSIPRERMRIELRNCLKLKQEFPDLICGFDLVGAEDRPNSISFYADLLVEFTEACATLPGPVSIPFMFHAGETLLDTGGSHDPSKSNLYDSLLLNAKRIGHGYALLKHPMLVERYKAAGICLELCPISNELLHLCGNAREHPFPELLAAGLHCSLNSDNPSLFRSSLSHEFYQVMVGDTRMTLHGWRQLVEWSIEHSCLSEEEQMKASGILARAWEEFCEWVVKEYGSYADGLPDLV